MKITTKKTHTLGTLLVLITLSIFQKGYAAEMKTVPEVDLEQYSGLWYEIARLPNRFQTVCARDVTANYKLIGNGRIEVTNRCIESDGAAREAVGSAKLADKDGPNSKLKVRFAPAFLSFLPMVWGDYWIFDLASDYSSVLVGSPNAKYLWILARTPEIPDVRYQELLKKGAQLGFDVDKMVKTQQSGATLTQQD